jgi:hypothetical protein
MGEIVYIKMKDLCSTKDTGGKVNRQVTNWNEEFATSETAKRLISNIK